MARTKRRYWLFKSEADVFPIDALARCPQQTTSWEGVRNYQVRNMLRDDIKTGDGVLFYHSRTEPMIIAGTAQVVRDGYPDHFALNPQHKYYDEKSTEDDPRWYMVDIQLSQEFAAPVTRDALKSDTTTAGMAVLSKGSRLSITPVTESEWKAVHRLAGVDVE
ncbi:MAG: EVE domain-containing protein [Planctomycetaceae bacterium]|nr:EVE domain-containing protein [Planctomycetaceae bacterium]